MFLRLLIPLVLVALVAFAAYRYGLVNCYRPQIAVDKVRALIRYRIGISLLRDAAGLSQCTQGNGYCPSDVYQAANLIAMTGRRLVEGSISSANRPSGLPPI